MKKLYTSIGRFCHRGHGDRVYPYVMVNKQEYVLDVQEMLIWSLLNWQLLENSEIELQYQQKCKDINLLFHRSSKECLARLIQRGLVIEGCGETGADALYDLLSGLYVVPISENCF